VNSEASIAELKTVSENVKVITGLAVSIFKSMRVMVGETLSPVRVCTGLAVVVGIATNLQLQYHGCWDGNNELIIHVFDAIRGDAQIAGGFSANKPCIILQAIPSFGGKLACNDILIIQAEQLDHGTHRKRVRVTIAVPNRAASLEFNFVHIHSV
jgi:hypothetical protein